MQLKCPNITTKLNLKANNIITTTDMEIESDNGQRVINKLIKDYSHHGFIIYIEEAKNLFKNVEEITFTINDIDFFF